MANGRARRQEENWLRDGVKGGVGRRNVTHPFPGYRLAWSICSRSHTDHDSESQVDRAVLYHLPRLHLGGSTAN